MKLASESRRDRAEPEYESVRALGRSLPIPAAVLRKVLDSLADKNLERTPNTQICNQTGQPAVSLPLHTSPHGHPIGVQLIGRFGDEATLLRLASQLEAAHPWLDRRPTVTA